MAAPSATARQTPVGKKLLNGYPTKIAFASDPDVSFWEKTVGAPSLNSGDAVDITDMHNTRWRTVAPRPLVSLGEFTLTVAYDPDVYNQILALLGKNDQITVHFPDGSTIAFWGYLQSFEPAELSEEGQPEATITIVPTNYDDVNDVEAGPVITSVPGT